MNRGQDSPSADATPANNYDIYKFEYDKLCNFREMLSRNIMIWGQICIPICASIVTLFLYAIFSNKTKGYNLMIDRDIFKLSGWLLFISILLFWRGIVRHIDKQLVYTYPRMIQIEQELDMAFIAQYFYYNLSNKSIQYIASWELQCPAADLKKLSYNEFEQKIKFKPHCYLLLAWSKYQYKSIKSRGHLFQNIIVVVIIFLTFFGIIFL